MDGDNVGYTNKRNYSWAAFLILLGIVLLLNTTSVVGWGIWTYVIRFWPILIVLIGIRIILGNSVFGRVIGMIFTILLTTAAFGVAYMQLTSKSFDFLPEKVNNWVLQGGGGMFNLGQEIVQGTLSLSSTEYSDVTQRNLKMDVGACKFTILDEDIQEYITIDSTYPITYNEPELIHSFQSGILDIILQGAGKDTFVLFYDESSYDVVLGQLSIPSSFDIKLGAGSGEILLESVSVKDFWAEVGAGKLDVQLDVSSIPSGETRLLVGAGKMNFKLPSRVGYVLEYDLGVGSITIDGESVSGASGGRGKYTSSNYDSSDMKLNMYVNVGVGSFNIDSL